MSVLVGGHMCLYMGNALLGAGIDVTAGGQRALSGGSLGNSPKEEQ